MFVKSVILKNPLDYIFGSFVIIGTSIPTMGLRPENVPRYGKFKI